MNPWRVFLKFDKSNSEKELELFDAKSYFGGYLKIKRSYFNKLVKITKMTKKYSTERAIERVMSPDETDWTLNPWMLLLIKDDEKGRKFWFFIKREKDLSGLLIAIGPKLFVEYNKVNSEAKREIKQIINYIITYFNKFQVIILLPNNLI